MEKIRDIGIGMAGFITSLTLKQWTDLGSAAAGWATAIYMACLIVDWAIAKHKGKRCKHGTLNGHCPDCD